MNSNYWEELTKQINEITLPTILKGVSPDGVKDKNLKPYQVKAIVYTYLINEARLDLEKEV